MAMAILVAGAPATAEVCDPGEVRLLTAPDRGAEQETFSIEIARTPEEQARGLMFRPHLDRDAGMLFVMDPPREAHFWMRNTMISLDLLFIDRAGKVVNIEAKAVPFSERGLRSEGEVRAVLEINGGLSEALGIRPGAQAIHPVFDMAPQAHRCSG